MTALEIHGTRQLPPSKRWSGVFALLIAATGAAHGAADLLPQQISVSPAIVTAGRPVTVSFTVHNQGDITAPASQTKIQIKDSADLLVLTQSLTMPAIKALSSVSENRELTIPSGTAAGPYKAFIIVDNNREVAQGGTTGNDKSIGTPFYVLAPTASAPDLRPQHISVTPASVPAGTTLTVHYTVRNLGGTDAPASHTKIQIKDSADTLVLAQTFTIPGISAASSVSASRKITVPAGAAAGLHKVFIILDNNSEVAGGSTSGNDMSGGAPFTVTR